MSFSGVIEKLFDWMHAQSLRNRLIVIAAVTVVLAFIDYDTGTEFNFSFFYLIPVSMTAWFVNAQLGYVMCVISGVVWGVLNLGDQEWHQAWFPIWNAIMRMLFFFVVTKLIGIVHAAFERERLLSRTDYLTGVFNSRYIFEEIQSELDRHKRYGHEFILAYIDLDNFKKVNDTKGHSEGDRVLKLTTETMRKTLRKTDRIGRMGGDEFVVILPHVGMPGARVALAKMEQALLAEMRANGWPVTFSIGVLAPKTSHSSVDDLLKSVDALMYQVKGKGKNAILFDAS